MTVATSFTAWSGSLAGYDRCSPNLLQVRDYCAVRWQMSSLGCHNIRDIRGGTAISAHAFGAAVDLSYANVGRARALGEIIPWLIAHSEELGVQAIHDYLGARIWRAGRTSSVADATTAWWKASTGPGMGEAWATYVHIETRRDRWGDARPVASRLPAPAPAPLPPPTPQPAPIIDPQEDDMLRRYRDRRYANVWLLPHGLQLSGELDVSYAADGVPLIESTHDQTLRALMHRNGQTSADLVPA